jgi:hypothetical protein
MLAPTLKAEDSTIIQKWQEARLALEEARAMVSEIPVTEDEYPRKESLDIAVKQHSEMMEKLNYMVFGLTTAIFVSQMQLLKLDSSE